MKFNEVYYLYVGIETTKGVRLLQYSSGITDKGIVGSSGTTIHHGLGTESRDGTWQTFKRDLEADLKEFESDNDIISVNGFLVKGSGSFDDIELFSTTIDPEPITTIADIYAIGGDSYILTKASGEALIGDIILKAEDVNGDICYTVSGNIITQDGKIAPTNLNNNLLTYTCVGDNMATFTGTNSDGALNVSSLSEFATDTSLAIAYKTYITGEGINTTLERCNNSNETTNSIGEMVWSDNCLDMANANFAITDGSREDLVTPTNSTRINLTAEVGSEENNSGSGAKYNNNTNFYQWFYSVNSTNITNNMTDRLAVNAKWGDENFDDVIVARYGDINPDIIYVDSDNIDGTINTKVGYYKYCQVGVAELIVEETFAVYNNQSCSGNPTSQKTTYRSRPRPKWLISGIGYTSTYILDYIDHREGFGFIALTGLNVNGTCKTFISSVNPTPRRVSSTCATSGNTVWYKK